MRLKRPPRDHRLNLELWTRISERPELVPMVKAWLDTRRQEREARRWVQLPIQEPRIIGN